METALTVGGYRLMDTKWATLLFGIPYLKSKMSMFVVGYPLNL